MQIHKYFMMQCAWIENYLVIDTDGYTRPCCGETFEKSRIGNIQNGILNSFHNTKLIELRENLKNGYSEKTKPFCFRCEISEKATGTSLRTGTKFLSDKRELKKIQFKLSNKCQLACAHCGPNYSSKWAKILQITPYIQSLPIITDSFLKEFDSIFHQLESIKFTGGEPFLDTTHWNLLSHLKKFDRSNCTLEYITNGLIEPNYKLWEGWKEVNCTVSVDGFEKSYEWFRRGSKWDALIKRIEKLKKYANVNISYSLTPYTLQDYNTSKKFWGSYNFYTNQVITPLHCGFSLFPVEKIYQLPEYHLIPYVQETARNKGSINFYANWASKWDQQWHTKGWANKLFYWLA